MKKTRTRKQVPVRVWQDDWIKIQAKLKEDKLTYQKLVEVLLRAYIKDNKDVKKLVKRFSSEKLERKRRYGLTDIEAENLLKETENHSPLGEIRSFIKQIDEPEEEDCDEGEEKYEE